VQRQRILRAMAEVAAERGYAGASVGLVVARAGVSRRTFYGCFQSREACFLALLDSGLDRAVDLVSRAFGGEESWQDGVRAALASLLVFLDSERLFARVWLVESLAAGAWALERREHNLATLRELVLSRWPGAQTHLGTGAVRRIAARRTTTRCQVACARRSTPGLPPTSRAR
jgi:AcrR family transcriptional regulator